MTPEQAAWVREKVWTPAFRAVEASYPGGYLTRCPCEGGICGACDGTMDRGRPRHDQCLSRQRGGPIVHPLAYLTDGHFMVCGPALWPATGPSCRYICPCPCPKTGGPPSRPPRRGQAADRPNRQITPQLDVAGDDDALFDLEVSA